MFFYEIIGTIVSSGTRTVVSGMLGALKKKECSQAFSMSLIVGIGISTLMTLLTILFSKSLSMLLGARESMVLIPTANYLIGYAVGLPFFTGHRILTPYLQMEGDYKRINISAYVMTIVDIVADILVVFVFKGGMLGIGLATSVGYIVAFMILVSHFFSKERHSIFNFYD